MRIEYNNKIPKDAKFIIEELEREGYEAYIVGGCVRDLLMGREPHDWDITTSAKPEQVKEVFKRTYDTGIEHGTVTVIVDEEHYEVTTYRIEGEYKDHRHPEQVSFVKDITLDLSRRDFTMNAMAYHPERGFVDPYNGISDIQIKCIRSVRDAKERFEEDALRILRGVRFASQLGFFIEEETIQGIKHCKGLLENISKERIRDEFIKMCLSDRPEYMDILYELELLQYIVPEIIPMYHTTQNHPRHIYNVKDHTIKAMKEVPKEVTLRLTLLLHDIAKPICKTTDAQGVDHFYNHAEKGAELAKMILKDLRMDNHTIHDVSELIKYHSFYLSHEINLVTVKILLGKLGEHLFDQLLIINEADSKAKNIDDLPSKLEEIEKIRTLKNYIIKNRQCYSMKQLEVNGKDLIQMGYPKGKIIGELLEHLLTYVINNPDKNRKEVLLQYLEAQR